MKGTVTMNIFKKREKGDVIDKEIARKLEDIVSSIHYKIKIPMTEKDVRYCLQATNLVSHLLLGSNYHVSDVFQLEFREEYQTYFKPLKELLDKYGYKTLYK